jgi:NADPH:quinone reductase-like Zn-dependent oxidoreductase
MLGSIVVVVGAVAVGLSVVAIVFVIGMRAKVARSERRFDVIYQGAGTDSPLRLRRILTPTGTLVLSDGQGRFAGIDRIVKAKLLSPFVRQRMAVYVTKENPADLEVVRDLIVSGKVRPVIDRTYRLAEAPAAVRYLEAGHTQGKVVIAV